MKKIAIMSMLAIAASSSFAQKMTEQQFNKQVKLYQEQISKDEIELKNREYPYNVQNIAAYQQALCRIWDTKMKIVDLTADNRDINGALDLGNKTMEELIPAAAGMRNATNRTYAQYCRDIQILIDATGIQK
ncbi:hypothetical protein [Acinetobacter sp. T63]